MGANSKQGWYLFLFLIGFTFVPAGIVYLGFLFTVLGLACLIISLVGFYRIRPLEFSDSPANQTVGASVTSAAPAKRAV
jgi:hypothetical protein